MSPSDQPYGRGVTVNVVLFAGEPPTVTENVPDDDPVGTIALMMVALQLTTGAVVPLSEIVLELWVAPKLVPVIVTRVPTGPVAGDSPVIVGDWPCARPQNMNVNERATTKAALCRFQPIARPPEQHNLRECTRFRFFRISEQ
jgi:hypothetical protein